MTLKKIIYLIISILLISVLLRIVFKIGVIIAILAIGAYLGYRFSKRTGRFRN